MVQIANANCDVSAAAVLQRPDLLFHVRRKPGAEQLIRRLNELLAVEKAFHLIFPDRAQGMCFVDALTGQSIHFRPYRLTLIASLRELPVVPDGYCHLDLTEKIIVAQGEEP